MAMSPVLKLALRIVRANWPLVLQTWGHVEAYLKKHPELPGQAARQYTAIRAHLDQVSAKRSKEAQIAGLLDIVRDLTGPTGAATDAAGTIQSAEWRRRADQIGTALTLVTAMTGADRKKKVALLQGRTDALVAEVFESLVETPPDGRITRGRAIEN
ncbi:MAG: hypothetical protein JWP95_782 [Actinotalea sp.]|nr:hypothetical protein [Actinotalea sp.]